MIIKCVKCNELIRQAEVTRLPTSVKITVHHHGETDEMEMTHEWMSQNPDFVQAIEYGLTVGEAFKKKEEA